MTQYLYTRGPYLLLVALVVAAVYALIDHRDYLKAVVGLFLLQSSIILFFILLAVREQGSVPILPEAGEELPLHNPLPHALMLTAIVVGVATLGVAMAILRRIQAEEGSIREEPSGGGDEGEGGRDDAGFGSGEDVATRGRR